MRLHETIENENAAKRQFIADMDSYKKRFAQLENENRQLRSRTGQAAAEPRFNYPTSTESYERYESAEPAGGSKI